MDDFKEIGGRVKYQNLIFPLKIGYFIILRQNISNEGDLLAEMRLSESTYIALIRKVLKKLEKVHSADISWLKW